LHEELALNAGELCNKLREQARSAGVGSAAVDTLEWKAAMVIEKLLFERSEGHMFAGGNPVGLTFKDIDGGAIPEDGILKVEAPECNCAKMIESKERDTWGSFWICPAHGYKRR